MTRLKLLRPRPSLWPMMLLKLSNRMLTKSKAETPELFQAE